MKKHQMAVGVAALFGVVASPAAFADVTFNGFGQVMYGQTLDDASALGYDDKGSFAPESLFALQATAPVSDKLDAVAQIVARGKEHYKPEFAWAYARYQIDSDWTVKAGRQRAPFYRYSDYLEVGVAYPYIRTPLSVYGVVPFSNYDGINVGRGFSLGKLELSTQFIYGTFSDTVTLLGQQVDVNLHRVPGVVVEGSYDEWLSLRVSAFRANVSISSAGLDPLVAGLVATGNEQTAKDIAVDHDMAYFVGAALGITQGSLHVDAEYVWNGVPDGFYGAAKSWYVSAAYHLGALTPVASYGVNKVKPPSVTPVNASTPPELAGGVAAVLASVKAEVAYSSVGLRYDLSPNTAVKLDYTHVDPKQGGADSTDIVSAGLAFSF